MIKKLLIILILILPFLILVPHLDNYAYQPGSSYSDLTITHYPNMLYLLQHLKEDHEVPLWSNMILSGQPFAADPLSGIYYPPGWIVLLFPFPMGFNITVILHLIILGVGMFCFLKGEKFNDESALFGAILIELFPKLFAHFSSGHITLIYSVAWMPWLLWAEKRSRHLFPDRICRFLPSFILALIVLADVRWSAYSAIIWIMYGFYIRLEDSQDKKLLKIVKDWIFSGLSRVLISLLLASTLLIPFLEFLSLSTRRSLSPQDVLTLSLPPVRLLGLIVPDLSGYSEWMTYPGIASVLLLIFVLFNSKIRKGSWFWISAFFLSLLFSLGSSIPFLQVIANIPVLNLLRVPPRALIITGFSLSVLAAKGFGFLLKEQSKNEPKGVFSRIIVVGSFFIVMFAIGIALSSPSEANNFLWTASFLSIFSFLVLMKYHTKISSSVWFISMIVFTVLDLAGVGFSTITFKSEGNINEQSSETIDYIKSQSGIFRTYSPSYSIPQHLAAKSNIFLADGVNPMQIASYTNYFSTASGVLFTGYSVTMPPFATGNPETDNRNYYPDPVKLGFLNVKFVVSDFPIEVPDLEQVVASTKNFIYENLSYMPRAWVQPLKSMDKQKIVDAQIISLRPNQITIEASGPGVLILSEVDYPGWMVFVDGSSSKLERREIFRSVLLEEGSHQIEFVFRPLSVYVGLSISIITAILMILFIVFGWRVPIVDHKA